jgi:hypothetical protein
MNTTRLEEFLSRIFGELKNLEDKKAEAVILAYSEEYRLLVCVQLKPAFC